MMKEKIYLTPGLMTDERLWSRLKKYLSDEYELIHIPIPNSENFDEINDLIEPLFKEEKINILGFSLGSYIASYYAIKNPHRVNRVFNIAGTPSGTRESEIDKRKKKVQYMKEKGFEGLSYSKAVSLLEEKNQKDEELISIVRDMFEDLGKDTFISQMNSTFNRVEIFEDLKALDIPIWYYYSKNDRLLNKESIQNHLLNTKHNITIISREGTSHNIPLEEPEELSLKIKQWMKV